MQVRHDLGLPALGFPIAARRCATISSRGSVAARRETPVGCARGDRRRRADLPDQGRLVAPKYQRKGIGLEDLGIVLGHLETVAESGGLHRADGAPGTEAFFAESRFRRAADESPGCSGAAAEFGNA